MTNHLKFKTTFINEIKNLFLDIGLSFKSKIELNLLIEFRSLSKNTNGL